jgi:hypothetical protein
VIARSSRNRFENKNHEKADVVAVVVMAPMLSMMR